MLFSKFGKGVRYIDFGRSKLIEGLRSTLIDVAVGENCLMCRAMRNEGRWGVCLDLFGLCACLFSLLLGKDSKDMVREEEGKLCLRNKITATYRTRDIYEPELWNDFFDKLLNFDSVKDDYASVVGGLRKEFGECVKKKKAMIEMGFGQLLKALPKALGS